MQTSEHWKLLFSGPRPVKFLNAKQTGNFFLSEISICNHNSLRGLKKKKNESTRFKMQQTENDTLRKK